ncbi:MAG: class II aldolase/adducin family protein [Clostridiales bacterium]|nr:class II aldolase/adducin family protein [Clostridiales bacterium]MDD7034976.1 class II aldolase/adducin family protein [Bacillota bacterium]MDY2920263.1 class II aldolase/adducin family protein [Lentihominibacter sp.]
MRNAIAETGRELLKLGLVARTWGNISERTDEEHFAITPSGLDYRNLTGEDMATVNVSTGAWTGRYKPSGEWAVHREAYRTFDDVNFVIHTHQTFATIASVLGLQTLHQADDAGLAAYGLPGSDKLTGAVSREMRKGHRTILMAHHGVLICAGSREEALERALGLEEVCRANVKYTEVEEAVERVIAEGSDIYTVLDDVAQMIGRKIPLTDRDIISGAAVHREKGILVKAADEDDEEALRLLVEKACLCSANGGRKRLSRRDVWLMHRNYVKNYSRLRNSASVT